MLQVFFTWIHLQKHTKEIKYFGCTPYLLYYLASNEIYKEREKDLEMDKS